MNNSSVNQRGLQLIWTSLWILCHCESNSLTERLGGGHKYSRQSPIYSHLGPRGNRGGRIHMYDGRVCYCDASWQPWAHRRSDKLSRFTCQRSGTTADPDSLLYQTQREHMSHQKVWSGGVILSRRYHMQGSVPLRGEGRRKGFR